jgi:MFS family permease
MNRATPTYLHVLRDFNRDVRLYLITTMLIGLTVDGGVYTVLFNLYLLRLGYGPEFIGLVNGSGMLLFALFCLPAGTLSGRLGNRRMMIGGLSLLLIGCGLLPFAELHTGNWRAGWLFITWCFAFIGFAVYFVNTAPFAMKVAHQSERNHVFSVQAALWSLAGFAGSLIGGFLPGIFAMYLGVSLDQPAPYRYSLLAASLLLIPSVLAIGATREVHAQSTTERQIKGEPSPLRLIAFLTLVRLLVVTGVGTLFIFFNVYMDAGLHISTVHIGVLSALGRLLSIPTALIVPLLTRRWGNGRTAAWASLGTAVSMLPLILVSHWSAAGLGFIGVLALTSIRYPTFLVYTMEVVPPARRGTMSGAGEMASGLSFSSMALGGGYIIEALGYRSLFLTGASLTVIGTLSFLIYLRSQQR